jgi:hypothetical protein
MVAKEGFRRVAAVGQRVAMCGSLLLLIGVFTLPWVSASSSHWAFWSFWVFFVPGAHLLLIGCLLLVAAWIGGGFADA